MELPALDVLRLEVEDWGAPEIDFDIKGCVIKNEPVDGGSNLNLMTESIAFELGLTKFQPTQKVLWMADQ